MRNIWTFFAGIFFAAWVVLWTSPLLVGAAALSGWGGGLELFRAFSGESVFGVREEDGRLVGRMVNVNFRTAMAAMPGDPRPRRLLLRLETVNADVFNLRGGEGRVRLDAWPLDGVPDMLQPPLYTVIAAGASAEIDEQGALMVDRGTRRSVYSLTDGAWMFDSDAPSAAYTADGERRRYVAVAASDEEFPEGSIAVVTLASSSQVLQRVLIKATDPSRARLLRTSIGMTRPVLRLPEPNSRWADLSLPAGAVRMPIIGDRFDLSRAETPLGLTLSELTPWNKTPARP